jgi:enamine deaminase RidA (YjgF/YER057c/UK114 family)
MEAAGGTTDNIVKMRLMLSDDKYRENLNKEWLKMFPDPNSRPARHAETVLRVGQGLFNVEITAVMD